MKTMNATVVYAFGRPLEIEEAAIQEPLTVASSSRCHPAGTVARSLSIGCT